MPPRVEVIALLYFAAATAGLVAAAVVWHRRGAPGARALAWMLIASAFWAFWDAVELQAESVGARRLISQVQYLGVVSAAPLFLHAAFGLGGRTAPLPRSWFIAIWIVPALTLAVAWTSSAHTWLWTAIRVPDGGLGPGIYEYGWWFWVLAADHYLLSALGLAVLVQASRRVRKPFRGPLVLVALAIALPWVGNIVYVFKLGPWPGFNWLGVSIIASGVTFAWLVLREALFDTLPAAREAIIAFMADAVLVVDDGGRVLMANAAAHDLLGLTQGGRAPEALLDVLRPTAEGDPPGAAIEVELPTSSEPTWFEVRRGDVHDRWGASVAHLIVVRDVSRRKRVELEREALITDLSAALGRIQALEGLLPICAHCKKIRDDQGTWRRLEAYFESRTRVEFTHGICPDCSREYFGGVARR